MSPDSSSTAFPILQLHEDLLCVVMSKLDAASLKCAFDAHPRFRDVIRRNRYSLGREREHSRIYLQRIQNKDHLCYADVGESLVIFNSEPTMEPEYSTYVTSDRALRWYDISNIIETKKLSSVEFNGHLEQLIISKFSLDSATLSRLSNLSSGTLATAESIRLDQCWLENDLLSLDILASSWKARSIEISGLRGKRQRIAFVGTEPVFEKLSSFSLSGDKFRLSPRQLVAFRCPRVRLQKVGGTYLGALAVILKQWLRFHRSLDHFVFHPVKESAFERIHDEMAELAELEPSGRAFRLSRFDGSSLIVDYSGKTLSIQRIL